MNYSSSTYKLGSSSTTVPIVSPSSSLPSPPTIIQSPAITPTNGSTTKNLEIWIPSVITLGLSILGGIAFYFSTITDIKNNIATLSADQKNLISKVDDLQRKNDSQYEKIVTLEKDLIRTQVQNEFRSKK